MRTLFSKWFLALIYTLSYLLSVKATITGTKYCNAYMCVTGKHDNTSQIDTYTLEPPSGKTIPLKSFGWIAIGFGSTMANSPMVIVWPNTDGSITLSQRQARTVVMPTVVSNPARKATLVSASSFSNTTTTSITFTLPANTTASTASYNKTAIIWAYGTTNPGSSSSSASFTQHLASGNTQLALLSPLTTNSSTASNPTSTSNSGDTVTTNSKKNILIAHVACGALATMFLLPMGIIVPRLARGLTDKRWWFPVHAVVNGLLAFVLIVAAFAIARANFHSVQGFGSSHRKLGLTLFILALFQTILGLFTHFFKKPHRFQTSSGRGPSNFIHIALGLVVVAIGFGTVWKGIAEEWGMYSGSGNPNVGWKVGWGLIVAITAIVYVGGFYFLPRQLSMERQRRTRSIPIDRDGKYGESPSTSEPQYQGDYQPPPPPPSRPPPPTYATPTNGGQGQGQGQRRLPPPLPSSQRPVGGQPEYELATR